VSARAEPGYICKAVYMRDGKQRGAAAGGGGASLSPRPSPDMFRQSESAAEPRAARAPGPPAPPATRIFLLVFLPQILRRTDYLRRGTRIRYPESAIRKTARRPPA
jgi:hypothetical protein